MQELCRGAEFKDNERGRDVIRVGEMAALLATCMGLPEDRVELIRETAPLHDIGKIGIPDTVLLKPGKLDDKEREVIQQHPLYGCIILGEHDVDFAKSRCDAGIFENVNEEECEMVWMSRTIALLHHEKWDGTGYPFGLKGDEIPLECRIVSLVDVFDALNRQRCYKPQYTKDACLDIIRRQSGSHFDPAIVDAFFTNLDAIMEIQTKWQD